jgi:hypothetical protein
LVRQRGDVLIALNTKRFEGALGLLEHYVNALVLEVFE